MILVKDAIESAAWLEVKATVPTIIFNDPYDVDYRIRVLGFSKIDLRNLGEYDGLQDWQEQFMREIGVDANLWKLDLDVVNMGRSDMPCYDLKRTLCLEDRDGYKFKVCDDSWLNHGSPYANKSGLANLHLMKFPPKIKKTGAFSFELPEFFDDLYISAHIGTVQEI